MRISDWSSDVCSSDLLDPAPGVELRVRGRDVDVAVLAQEAQREPALLLATVAALPDLADERRRQVVAQPVAALGENLRLVGPDLLVQLAQRRFLGGLAGVDAALRHLPEDRKSTRLNSSH